LRGDIEAENVQRAARWSEQAREHLDSGGFAGAVWTEKAEEAPAIHVQVQVVHRNEIAKLFD